MKLTACFVPMWSPPETRAHPIWGSRAACLVECAHLDPTALSVGGDAVGNAGRLALASTSHLGRRAQRQSRFWPTLSVGVPYRGLDVGRPLSDPLAPAVNIAWAAFVAKFVNEGRVGHCGGSTSGQVRVAKT